jgi:hypothetical protein
MSADEVVKDLIDAAQVIAKQTTEKAIGYADDAQTAAITVTDLGPIPSVDKPDVVIPGPPPDPDDAEDKFRGTFAELFNTLGPEFDDRFNAFLARFFPKIDECLQSTIDNWICDVIQNGTSGIPPDVENQIWERSRARELRDAAREEDELISNWAGRGFALPPGALYDAQQLVHQKLSEKISTHSRDVAIKHNEIQIETIKFAVAEGIKLRLGALAALVTYLRTWLDLAKISSDYANGILQSRAHLYTALSQYYAAVIAAERLLYDWGNDERKLIVAQQKEFVDLVNGNTNARVNAAISAANSMASTARAALSAQNTLAKIDNTTNIQG